MENTITFTEPHLEQIYEQTQEFIEELKQFESLTYQQLNWKPAPTSWSIIECIDHLKKTNEQYLIPLQKALEDARIRNLKAQKPFKSAWFGKFFANQMKPNGRKIKAPALFSPQISNLDIHILREFIALKTNILTYVQDLNGLDIQRMKISSPISKLIVFRVGDALQIVVNHDFRHLEQARNVQKDLHFLNDTV